MPTSRPRSADYEAVKQQLFGEWPEGRYTGGLDGELARLTDQAKGRNRSIVGSIASLLEACEELEITASGDSNDAEIDAGHNLASCVQPMLEELVDTATNTIEVTNFLRTIANFTLDGEPNECDDGRPYKVTADDAIDTVHSLTRQARRLLAVTTGTPAVNNPRAEQLEAWVDTQGVAHARITFPDPGYNGETVVAELPRLRRRARAAIRRQVASRNGDQPASQYRIRITDDQMGLDRLMRSITYSQVLKPTARQ